MIFSDIFDNPPAIIGKNPPAYRFIYIYLPQVIMSGFGKIIFQQTFYRPSEYPVYYLLTRHTNGKKETL